WGNHVLEEGGMPMRRRVVITGFGVLTPIGLDPGTFWSGLTSGKSGVGPITRSDPSGFPTTIAAEVDGCAPPADRDRKEARRMDRFAQYGLAAARQALERAGLKIEGRAAERVGVMVGTGSGGLDMIQREYSRVLTQGPDRLSPYLAPAMLANMASGEIAVATGARGISAAVVTA